MHARSLAGLALALALIVPSWVHDAGAAAPTGRLPAAVNDCARTTITGVFQRLEDGTTHAPIPGSGSAVSFANGLNQVSYDEVAQVNAARAGDQVVVCLISVPKDCPPGDDRGKVYTTVDLRTLKAWTLPDSEHMCGGA